MNYSQKARNLTNRLNAINKEVNETFKQFHKETGNKYVSKPNLTIAKMNSLKKSIRTFKPENFKNGTPLKFEPKKKKEYYKLIRNLENSAREVFDNKQKRVNLVYNKNGKPLDILRNDAKNIVQGTKKNLKP